MNPRLTPLAAALSVAFLAPAHAQNADLDPVIVSATRFSEPDTNVAANVSVITRDDIRNTPARDLPSMPDLPKGKRLTRLDTAKVVIRDFISRRKTDRIGIVVFGKAAYVLSPPTLDYSLLSSLVQRMELDYLADRKLPPAKQQFRELENDLFFVLDEKGHTVHLTESGINELSPVDHDEFSLPDISTEIHRIERDTEMSPPWTRSVQACRTPSTTRSLRSWCRR